MPFGFSWGGGRRSYKSGWGTPSTNKYSSSSSTIRDTGDGSGSSQRYKSRSEEDQSFEEIRDELAGAGELWEDPEFPAEDSSLFFQNPPSVWPNIEWLRPHEIHDDPQLIVEDASRLDINQGVLGDCWLLAAVSCLATNKRLLYRVIPEDQNFTDSYAGIFRFNFWQYGRWVEVMIDDRLPCTNGKLIYMHSDNTNEFWSALIEKAYAKLNGSYEALSGGLTSEALTDFTGGVVERFVMREEAPDDLFKRMLKAHKRLSLMGCSIDASAGQMEAKLDNGLIIGHAYSITDVRYVEIVDEQMVRVRNPWGDHHEWNGRWSDGSEEWEAIPEEHRPDFDHDGEFWMCYEDFKNEFQRLEICYLGPDTVLPDDEGGLADACRKWEGELKEGQWKRRVNAGGCRNYLDTFWTNPQYRVHIEDPDDDDEDGNGTIIVGVMQKNRRKMKSEGQDNLTLGYAVYQLDDPNCGTLDKRFFQTHASAARSPQFINMREVSDHHSLPPGDYVIIPSTFEPGEEGDFIVRVYSEKKDEVNELDDATGTADPDASEFEDVDFEADAEKIEGAAGAFEELAGRDGEIDAYELKDILNGIFMDDFEFDGFSADMTRSMVSMFDSDLSGKLGFEDYKELWSDLLLCKKAFLKLDVDNSGYFQSYEFRHVLNIIASRPGSPLEGLKVSNSTFNAIVMRYSDKEGHVRFDDFVACVIKLKTMFQTFKENDRYGSGEAKFGQDEFIQMTMYS